MPKQFTASTTKTKRKYIIKNFLALGTMTNIISQAGVGKTYFALQLAVDVALGKKFLGMDVGQMKVLLIDQDQSEDETEMRLAKFLNHYGVDTHENLQVSCTEYLQLKDGTLEAAIKSSEANLIIIDSLTAVCNGLNMSDSTNMQKLKELYEKCINEYTSIVFLHHMSEHREFTYGDAMTCNPGSLSLYSSVINGTLDGYYVLFNPHKGKSLKELIVRPIIKRFNITTGIFKTGLIETDSTLNFTESEKLEIDENDIATHEELVLLNFFAESVNNKPAYFIKEIITVTQEWKATNIIRTLIQSLTNKKLLELHITSHNKFSYSITKKGLEMVNKEYNKMDGVIVDGDPVLVLEDDNE